MLAFASHKKTIRGFEDVWCRALRADLNMISPVFDVYKLRETQHRYCQDNPEKVRECVRKWCENKPERVREKGCRYRQNNPEKVRERNQMFRRNHLTYCGECYQKNREGLREYYSERNSKRIECERCMLEVNFSSLSRHQKRGLCKAREKLLFELE